MVLVEWLMVADLGLTSSVLRRTVGLAYQGQLFFFMAVPICLILSPLSAAAYYCLGRNPHYLVRLVLSSLFLIFVLLGCHFQNEVRRAGFKSLADRSAYVIQAIRDFETRFGRLPFSIEDLSPKILEEVPTTGMLAYPEYELTLANESGDVIGDNPWMLEVFCPSGGINFDTFIYLPNGSYPAKGFGGWLERIGDWAYVHE